VVARKLSVRETERHVARQAAPARPASARPAKTRDITRLEERLADALTAAVEIRVKRRTRRGEQGEIAIAFGSLDELNGLLDKLGAAEP
jgi:ParB family chromosome partitioning protein